MTSNANPGWSGRRRRDPRSCRRTAFLVVLACVSLGGCVAAPQQPGSPGAAPAWFEQASRDEVVVPSGSSSRFAGARNDDEDLSGSLDLASLIELAFERNPALQAARERYRAAVASYGEAVALPDPMLQWTARGEAVQTRTGPQTDVYGFTQGIPFPGKLILRGEIATDAARISREAFLISTRDLIAELKSAYFELAYLHQAIDIVRQTQDLAEHLASKGRAELGENQEVKPDQVSLFDALQAEAQLSQLSYDLATLMELRSAEETTINRILDRPPAAAVGAPRTLPYRDLDLTREQLYELTAENRQELAQALIRIEKAYKERRLADLSWVPDFFLGGQYMRTGEPLVATPGAGDDPWGITMGVTVPLWVGKNQSQIEQAEHEHRAATRDRQAMFNASMEQVTRLFYRLSNTRRLVLLYRDSLIPQARSAMETSEQWQEIGRDNFGRVLEAQAVWLNFNLALARSVADHQRTLAQLEKAVGIPLGDHLQPPSVEDPARHQEMGR